VTRRKCRVFLAGEGPSEIGDLADEEQYRQGREGFLQPLLRKLVGDALELEFDGRKIAYLPGKRMAGVPGHGQMAGRALALAFASEAAALVFIKDVDRGAGVKQTEHDARRRLREMGKEIRAGFDAARSTSPELSDLVALAATPCRMIEAWALGDAEALGSAGASAADVPAKPELLHGDERDPQSNHPKRVLERALGHPAGRDDFAAIAEAADVETLERRCPLSFRPFAIAARAVRDGDRTPAGEKL
jgi:hypothetical protein